MRTAPVRPPLLYLSAADVDSVALGFAEAAAIAESAFGDLALGRAQLPIKSELRPRPGSYLHAMAAYLGGTDSAGIKWVSGYPENPGLGLPYIDAVIVLNDAATGVAAAIVDAAGLTAVRTAAVTAVTLRALRPARLQTASVLGVGVQGRAHVRMLLELFPELGEIRIFDIAEEALALALEDASDPRVRAAAAACDAVEGAEVVVSAVSERAGTEVRIESDWLAPSSVLLPLAGQYGWDADCFARSDLVFADDVKQFRHEVSTGYLDRFAGSPEPRELSHVVAGIAAGRGDESDRICAINSGLAVHDVALAARVVEVAAERGLGTRLPR